MGKAKQHENFVLAKNPGNKVLQLVRADKFVL